jgi:hypothetical protein
MTISYQHFGGRWELGRCDGLAPTTARYGAACMRAGGLRQFRSHRTTNPKQIDQHSWPTAAALIAFATNNELVDGLQALAAATQQRGRPGMSLGLLLLRLQPQSQEARARQALSAAASGAIEAAHLKLQGGS